MSFQSSNVQIAFQKKSLRIDRGKCLARRADIANNDRSLAESPAFGSNVNFAGSLSLGTVVETGVIKLVFRWLVN